MKRSGLAKVIRDALADFGGETVVKAITWHLEHTRKMTLEDIINRPDEFVSFLKDVYGSFEPMIERHIIDVISRTYGIPPERTLEDMLRKLREPQKG
ncbi:MAG: hypothetical protein ACP5GH_01665 [Nitrososphaeria archaeon]|jgi:hypothetical protein